jgi:hypothetical protein
MAWTVGGSRQRSRKAEFSKKILKHKNKTMAAVKTFVPGPCEKRGGLKKRLLLNTD